MHNRFIHLLPNGAELIGTIFATFLIVLLGNGKDLLARYGLSSSSAVVQQHIGNSFGSGLTKLDSFRFTNGVVTFGIWAIVGLVSLSVLQAVLRVSSEVSYEKEVGSSHYVHPTNFSRSAYWRQLLLNAFFSFGSLLLLCFMIGVYLFAILPQGFTYARRFLLHVTVPSVGYLLTGLAIVFIGTLALYICIKLVIVHHRYSKE